MPVLFLFLWYVVDAPVWRVTYRLDVDGLMAIVQCWVHLDNVFGYDWQEVAVELRSGRPTTFHAELFAPLMAERKSLGISVFDIPENITIVRQWYGFDLPTRFGNPGPTSSPFGHGVLLGGGLGGGGFGGGFAGGVHGGDDRLALGAERSDEDQPTLDFAEILDKSYVFGEAAGLHQIALKEPVSLQSGHSAAIPIFVGRLPVEQRVEFTARLIPDWKSDGHPVARLVIAHQRDALTLAGPVAIHRKGVFEGDSVIRRTPQQGSSQVDYGVDRGVTVSTVYAEGSSQLVKVTRRANKILVESRLSGHLEVTLVNEHQDTRTVDLRLPLHHPRVIFDPPPTELSDRAAIFRFEVSGASSESQTLHSVQSTTAEYQLSLIADGQFDWRQSGLEITPEDRAYFTRITEVKEAIRTLTQLTSQWRSQELAALQDQLRWARLVETLQRDSESSDPYIVRIHEAEALIAQLRQKTAEIQIELSELEAEYRSLIDGK